jgi:N,N'-diacetyllegionaminate synthase
MKSLQRQNRVTIIAEAGVNHNGCIHTALKLVEAASQSGADVVKFQTFSSESLATNRAQQASYQKKMSLTSNQLDMLKRLELSSNDHNAIIEHCKTHKIEFFSTAFDLGSLDYLNNLGLKSFKVPSGEITNLPYLRRIGSFGKPILLSTGMATLGEIEEAITILKYSGTKHADITVLHCTTEYPAPFDEVNLLAMKTLEQAFGVNVGYSDHTTGIEVSLAAATLGAKVIEKHFTLDRNQPGPDHAASVEVDELKKLVTGVRIIERALGTGLKRRTQSEEKNLLVVRKSIVASETIKKGDTFTESNLTTKRPGSGISPMRWNEIVGSIALRNYIKNDVIEK